MATAGVHAACEATLVDVARAAGVSPSTASRVLNGSERSVLPANERRVRDAAARLGYVVDMRAQATAKRQPGAFAIIVDSLTDAASIRAAADVHGAAEGWGLTVTLHAATFDGARVIPLIRALRGQRTSALAIVIPTGGIVPPGMGVELVRCTEHGGVVRTFAAGPDSVDPAELAALRDELLSVTGHEGALR